MLSWYIFFHTFTSNLSMSPCLKWVFCRQLPRISQSVKSEGTILHNTALTSDTNSKFRRFPIPPSNLIIYQKHSQNLLTAIILVVTAYYREKIQIKFSKGINAQGRDWKVPNTEHSLPLPWSEHVLPFWHQCVTIYMEYCQPRKFILVSMSGYLTGVSLHKHD